MSQIILSSYYYGALRYHGLLGPEGSPDFIGSQANGTSRYYFLKDHTSVDGQVSGSVRTTVDFTNTALGYDPDFHRGKLYPFGIRRGGMPGRSSSSSTPDDDYPDFIGTGHTLSAHWRKRDAELDLDYSSPERSRRVLVRNYDPLIGRFMQVDPLSSQRSWISPYNYTQNGPLNRIDKDGMLDTRAGLSIDHQNQRLLNNSASSQQIRAERKSAALGAITGLSLAYSPVATIIGGIAEVSFTENDDVNIAGSSARAGIADATISLFPGRSKIIGAAVGELFGGAIDRLVAGEDVTSLEQASIDILSGGIGGAGAQLTIAKNKEGVQRTLAATTKQTIKLGSKSGATTSLLNSGLNKMSNVWDNVKEWWNNEK